MLGLIAEAQRRAIKALRPDKWKLDIDKVLNQSLIEPRGTPRERDDLVYQRVVRDGLTLEQAGQEFGVTRERIRQILRDKFGWKAHDRWIERQHAMSTASYEARLWHCTRCDAVVEPGKVLQHKKEARADGRHVRRYIKGDHVRQRAVADDYAAKGPDGKYLMTQAVICQKWDIQPTTLNNAIREFGVPLRRPNTARLKTLAQTRARQERIRADHATGMTHSEIARKHGVSSSLVGLILNKDPNYQSPDRSESGKKGWEKRRERQKRAVVRPDGS